MVDNNSDSTCGIGTRGIHSDSSGEGGEQAPAIINPRGYIPYSEWVKSHPENRNATHIWHKKKQIRKK